MSDTFQRVLIVNRGERGMRKALEATDESPLQARILEQM